MTVPPDRLHARVAELEARLRDAEAVAAAKDEFIAAISRELSNKLAPVLLAVERMRAVLPAGDADRTAAALLLLERAVAAFDQRTRVLLNLADINAGIIPPAPAPTDLSALVTAAGERHTELACRAGCALSVDAGSALVASTHADALAQVLDFLLTNAFRFGAGRPVHMGVRTNGGHVQVSVADHGPGLSAAEADAAFSLFHRRRAALEPGLGVGLWVASRLVAAMGGCIWVDSTPGQGAHFHVSLSMPNPGEVAPPAENLHVRNVPADR